MTLGISDADTMIVTSLSSLGVGSEATDLSVVDGHAYIAGDSFRVVSVVDPVLPVIVGRLALSGERVTVNLPFAYITAGSRMHVVNVSESSAPVLVTTLDLPGSAFDIESTDTLVFVAAGSAGLHVIDVGNPSSPAIISSVVLSGDARGLEAVGSFVLVAGVLLQWR
jgi:hypothetical protein